jgi:hypothetical protein
MYYVVKPLDWIRIHAWGACDPGFKSQRPHHYLWKNGGVQPKLTLNLFSAASTVLLEKLEKTAKRFAISAELNAKLFLLNSVLISGNLLCPKKQVSTKTMLRE